MVGLFLVGGRRDAVAVLPALALGARRTRMLADDSPAVGSGAVGESTRHDGGARTIDGEDTEPTLAL